MDQQLAIVNPKERLSSRELSALETWESKRDKTPLALDIALGMYELFLNGHSCEEITRLSKKQGKDFPLGLVVDAAIRYGWYSRRDAHLQSLFDGIVLKIKQTQTEAVSFLTDMLAAAHKKHGDVLKEYIQTGDARLLTAKLIQVDSLHDYKNVVNLLLQVTGQGQANGGGTHVSVNVGNGGQAEVKTVDGKLKSAEVAELLKLVDSTDNE